MIIADLKAMIIAQLILPGQLQIIPDHLPDHFLKAYPRLPAKFLPGLGRISKQSLHLGGSEISWINGNDCFAGGDGS